MLKQTTLDKLKGIYGIDVDKLIAAIKAEEETDIELPEVVVMTPKELEDRDANKTKDGKLDGEKEVRAALVKEVAKRLNIEVSETARIGDLITSIEKVKNASDDQKLKMLNDQITNLQRDKESLSKDLEGARSEADSARFDSTLIAKFPVNRAADMPDSDRLLLLKANLKFEQVDGKLVAKKNGEVLRDGKTQNPLGIDEVVNSYFSERNWIGNSQQQQQTPPSGRGGKDIPPPANASLGIKKFSQFEEKWTKENSGKNTMSDDFTNALKAHVKENPDFDMYN